MTDITTITLRRTVSAAPQRVWQLWTTPEGIASWWAPDGFRTAVELLDLRVGGSLDYTMTAVGPEQVAFMEGAGLPLSTRSHKRFTEIVEPTALGYLSLIDFVPDHEPYEHLTTISLRPHAVGTEVVMQLEPLHDQIWTDRIIAGRTNELDNLEQLVSGPGGS